MDAAAGRQGAQDLQAGELRAALDAVPVPVLSVRPDGTASFANRAFARWSGQPSRSATGRPVELLLGPQAGECVRSALTRPVNNDVVTVDLSVPSASGDIKRLELTIDTHGRRGELPTGATVSVVEQAIESRTDDSAALELRAMVDAVAPAVALVDAEWRLLRWNPAFANSGLVSRQGVAEGSDFGAVMSRLVVHRLGPRPSEGSVLPDVSAAAGGRVEFESSLPTGRRYRIELTSAPDGRVVVMVHDITDSSRTTEELRRSERMRTIGQLTGGVAHDFNNLLAVIVGNLDLLEDQGLFGEQRSLVQSAKRSALRGASLTGSLLTFQRRAAGQPEPTSPTAMVENLERVLRRTLGGQVNVETRLTTSPWKTHVDPGLLENAIVNLAINARDAMPDGGTLTISTASLEGGLQSEDGSTQDALVVSVKDDGVGMSEEVRLRATEAFFTTKTEGRGTGLGLAMVRRFVRAAQGRIVIVSEEGQGTEVRILLPRHVGPSATGDVEPSTPSNQGQGRHVLLAEDNAHVRNTFRGMLQRLGYRVTDVDRPEVAVDLLERNGDEYDVFIVDARFPNGPSGVEIARRFTDAHPRLRTLLMSGHPETERPFGIPVLSKPCTLSALGSVLAALEATE